MKTFLILVLLVILSQVLLLKPIIGQGLTTEDYFGFYSVKVSKDTMFTHPINYSMKIGIHDSAHNMYIGILDILFGENYNMYTYFNIFFKIVATLLFYPLILIISKNKLLAFLGTLLYGISYPSSGALALYVVGNEYLGVALFNLFLIGYFYCVKKISTKLLFLTSLLIILSFLVLPIRVFPIFAIITLIEICLLLGNKFRNTLSTLYRVLAIFLPITIIMLFNFIFSGTGAYDLVSLPIFLDRIARGNWYLLLYPLWGLGYTYLPVAYFHIFGKIDISNLSSYLTSLLNSSLLTFIPISLLLSLAISGKKLQFFLRLTAVNFFFNIIYYIFYTHHFHIPENLVHGYSGPSFNAGLYTGLIGVYVISVAINFGIEWYFYEKKKLYLMIFISPLFSLWFIICQWFFTRDYYMYQEGIHRYFVIPAMGSYLFIASILTTIYQSKKFNPKLFVLGFIILLTIQIFTISNAEISQVFNGKKGSGRDLTIQQSLQSQTFNYINKNRLNKDMIFFIKLKSPILGDANRWEDTFDWRNLTFWMPMKISTVLNKPIENCTILTIDYKELQKMAAIQNESKGFLYKDGGNKESRCARSGKSYILEEKFVSLDDFYAFRITDDLKVVNITEAIKKDLVFY